MTQSEAAPRDELEERLRFETLLADLMARFVNLPNEQVGFEIQHAQRRIVETLDLDRCALWQRPEREPDTLRLASHYEAGRAVVERAERDLLSSSEWLLRTPDSPPALLGIEGKAFFPWISQQLLCGERVVISTVDRLPVGASHDKEILRRVGTKSTVVIPLAMGGAVIGALSFAMVRHERAWPEPLVDRFQLIAQVFADALARSRADQVLRQSEARLNLAAASAGARLWELDMGTGRLWATEEARVSYGLAPGEELTLERFLGIVHPDDRARVREVVQHGLQPGQDVNVEYRVVRPDGNLRWIATRGRLHPGSAGEPDRLLGVSLDVTEHKRMDEELEARLREIERLKQQLERDNISLREEVELLSPHEDIVGESAAMRAVKAQVEQVAPTDSTVLVVGETGTGKELVARAIQKLSQRNERPLVTVNCASLPLTLIEAELFGREKGAYTGAAARMAGRFEVADGATLFLDEIGELPLEAQAKLLRVLEDGRFERLGSGKTLQVDVRIIAATNRDLAQDVKAGKFRSDLYYRLCVFPIVIPPLRDRPEDIVPLVWAFVRHFEKQMGKRIESIPKRSLEALRLYAWPGNARELRNVIEHAMIVSPGPTLEVRIPALAGEKKSGQAWNLREVERQHILSVLEKTGWRVMGQGGASELLGLKRTTLQARMKKLGIHRPVI
jgi:formate hydrogenlyase transcriptional activator